MVINNKLNKLIGIGVSRRHSYTSATPQAVSNEIEESSKWDTLASTIEHVLISNIFADERD